MVIEPLDAIGQRHGTDKSSAHHDYLRHYETIIGLQKGPVRKLLEIGVFDGGSLRTWHDFLPDAEILGLDIDPRCLAFAGPNMTVEMCDQSDVTQLLDVGRRAGPFDVVIDDGSHVWSHQILTFETLFPFVKAGGIFIVEDIDTSYGHYVATYGRDSVLSAGQYVTKLANYVLASTAADWTQERDLRIKTFVPMIDSITFIRRSAIIRRK